MNSCNQPPVAPRNLNSILSPSLKYHQLISRSPLIESQPLIGLGLPLDPGRHHGGPVQPHRRQLLHPIAAHLQPSNPRRPVQAAAPLSSSRWHILRFSEVDRFSTNSLKPFKIWTCCCPMRKKIIFDAVI